MKKILVMVVLLILSIPAFSQQSVNSCSDLLNAFLNNANNYDEIRNQYRISLGALYEPLLEELNGKDLSDFSDLYDEEILAIFGYMRNEFQNLNPALRSNNIQEMNKFKNQIILIQNGLNKAPKYTAPVYRGERVSDTVIDSYRQAYLSGEPLCRSSFMSTSWGELTYPGNIHLTIYGKSGVKVDNLTFLTSEQEVLFPAGLQFKVTNFVKKPDFYEIEMHEID